MKNGLEQLFDLLNQKCMYLILRNWDRVFDEAIYGFGHEDVDILCDNVDEFISLTGAYRVHESNNRDNFEVRWGSQIIRFDVRWVGDGYYPIQWERSMLMRRIKSSSDIYIPCPEDYFYSLTYHALLQKPTLSSEYLKQLDALYKKLGNKDVEIDEKDLLVVLHRYMKYNKIEFEVPNDPGVYINWVNIGIVSGKNVWFRKLKHNTITIIRNQIIYYAKCAYLYLKIRPQKKKICNQLLINYLEKGDYNIFYRKTIVFVKKDTPASILAKITGEDCMYNVGQYSVIGEREGFRKAQVAVLTANSIRFFDYKIGETFCIFENDSQRELLKKAVSIFSPFFCSTVLSIENSYSVEKIINYIPRKKWSDSVALSNYYHLLELYIDYLKTTAVNGLIYRKNDSCELPADLGIQPEDDELFRNILNLPIVKTLPYTFCHGDMHFRNILLDHDSNELFLIDYEFARDEVFFYDFFNFMYVDYTDYHNTMLLDLYLDENTKMIDYFERAFNVVGVKFDINYKLFYIEYFLLSRFLFYTRWNRSRFTGKDLNNRSTMVNNNIHLLLGYIRQHESWC